MPQLTSKFRLGFDNLNIEVSRICKIQLKDPTLPNHRLWILYFWGVDESNKDKIIRTWFYQSEKDRATELKRIQEKYPALTIVHEA